MLSQLEQRLEVLQEDYKQLTGGQSVCEIGRSNNQAHPVKSAEGRMQAMVDCISAIKKHPDEEPRVALTRVQEKWQKLSEIAPAWRDYKQAGLEEIEQLLTSL